MGFPVFGKYEVLTFFYISEVSVSMIFSSRYLGELGDLSLTKVVKVS